MILTLIRALIFTVLVPGTIVVYLPQVFYSHARAVPDALGVFRYLGLLPIAAGALGYLVCAGDFLFRGRGTPAIWFTKSLRFLIGQEPQVLVRSSLYRYVRNPMYVSVVTILLGEAVWFGSPDLLLYAACAWLFFHVTVVAIEEPHLRRTRPDYENYCRQVPRWIPKLP